MSASDCGKLLASQSEISQYFLAVGVNFGCYILSLTQGRVPAVYVSLEHVEDANDATSKLALDVANCSASLRNAEKNEKHFVWPRERDLLEAKILFLESLCASKKKPPLSWNRALLLLKAVQVRNDFLVAFEDDDLTSFAERHGGGVFDKSLIAGTAEVKSFAAGLETRVLRLARVAPASATGVPDSMSQLTTLLAKLSVMDTKRKAEYELMTQLLAKI